MNTGDDTNLIELKNLGPKSTAMLNAIGIHTRVDLENMGAIDSYRALKAQGYKVNLNLLYAIEAALLDTHWTKLPDDIKQHLKNALDAPRL